MCNYLARQVKPPLTVSKMRHLNAGLLIVLLITDVVKRHICWHILGAIHNVFVKNWKRENGFGLGKYQNILKTNKSLLGGNRSFVGSTYSAVIEKCYVNVSVIKSLSLDCTSLYTCNWSSNFRFRWTPCGGMK